MCFLLRPTRRMGKMSALPAFCDPLNGQGCGCARTTVETACTAREDTERAMRSVFGRLASRAWREGRDRKDEAPHRRRRPAGAAPVVVQGI